MIEDDYADQLQAQEPLATIIRETDEEYAQGKSLDSLDTDLADDARISTSPEILAQEEDE